MPNCCIVTCNNRSETKNFKNNGVTYHVFPKDPTIKEKWMNATGKGPNWFPVRRSVICSAHFQEKCYQPQNKSRRLFEWAIPTLKICHIVSTDCSKPTSRQTPESNTDNIARKNITPNFTWVTCGQKTSPTNANKDSQLPDESKDVFETHQKLKMRQKMEKYESMILKQKTKIRSLQKKCSRYYKRISTLEDTVKKLNEIIVEKTKNPTA